MKRSYEFKTALMFIGLILEVLSFITPKDFSFIPFGTALFCWGLSIGIEGKEGDE